MIPRRRHLGGTALLALTCALLAGCGGGADPGAGAAGGTTPTDPGATGTDPGATGTGTTPGSTVAGGGAAGGAASTGGVEAKIPMLNGEDLDRGVGGGGGLLTPLAELPESEELPVPTTPLPTNPLPSMPTPTTPEVRATFSGAEIYVNGTVHTVNKGDSFPEDNPLWRLKSVTSGSIELELVAGEFSGGGSGVFLQKGVLESLVNASEGTTYKVKYLRGVEGVSTTF